MNTTTAEGIEINHQPSLEHLSQLGVFSWPTWTKEISHFPWTYDESETCYLLEGKVIITPENGEAVTIGKGDLVTFTAGIVCTWEVLEPVRKHYCFG